LAFLAALTVGTDLGSEVLADGNLCPCALVSAAPVRQRICGYSLPVCAG
jgi:hypothetical protein